MPEEEKTNSGLYKDLKALLEDGSRKAELETSVHGMHAADLAEIFDDLDDREREQVLSLLDIEETAEVFDEASENQKEEILENISDKKLVEIVEAMPPDEAAGALEYIEEERADLVLNNIDDEQAEDIREIFEFEEDTAGRIMTTEYLAVAKDLTAGEVIKEAKELTEDTETLHHIMVVDNAGRLIAGVRMEDLIKSEENTPIAQFMERAVICIHAERDQEVAARMMEKYDLAVLPVVGNGGKLIGIITFDDILEVMEEEASEDMFRLAGIGSADPFTDGIFRRAYKRLPWLITTLAGGVVLAVIIGHFQPTLRQVVALVCFIPVIAGLGGNVGIQSSTIMVRGLATGDIEGLRDVFWLLRREIAVGAVIGVAAGTALALSANLIMEVVSPEYLTAGGIGNLLWFCLILGISVLCGILAAAAVGTLAPLLCHRAGVDPAVAAGPFVTVSIDIITQTLYLSIATALLL